MLAEEEEEEDKMFTSFPPSYHLYFHGQTRKKKNLSNQIHFC